MTTRLFRLLTVAALSAAFALSACGNADENAGEDIDAGDSTDTASPEGNGTAAGTAPTIAGDWILTSLTVDGAPVEPPPHDLHLRIEQGEVSGDAGCNSFFGTIDRSEDGSVAFSALGGTEMACDYLDFETVYLPGLSNANSWSADPDGITFSGDGFEARYAPAPTPAAVPLEGTIWRLDTIYGDGDGPQRSVSSVDLQAPPILLTVDGTTATISGECADRVVTVDHDGDDTGGTWTVTDPGARDCSTAEGVGASQDLVSAAVEAATGYMIDGPRLILIGAEGELVGFVDNDLATPEGSEVDE